MGTRSAEGDTRDVEGSGRRGVLGVYWAWVLGCCRGLDDGKFLTVWMDSCDAGCDALGVGLSGIIREVEPEGMDDHISAAGSETFRMGACSRGLLAQRPSLIPPAD
jgi:hypothetical protein